MGLAKLWYCLSIIEPSPVMRELSNDNSIDSSSDSAMPRTGAPGMYRGLGLNKLGRPFQLSSSTSSVDVDPYSVPSGLELRGVVPRDTQALKWRRVVGLCIGLVTWLWAGDTGSD